MKKSTPTYVGKIVGTIVSALLLSLVILSCQKPADYLYIHPTPSSFSVTQKVREVVGNNAVDMFWAIGGMTEQAPNFKAGIQTFMQGFTQKSLAWRMAVSSSNTFDQPYLGMPAVFDNTSPTPTATFVTSVMNALEGMDSEQIFDPTVLHLTNHATFLRNNATLVVILTNDAHESSRTTTSATQMLNFLKAAKGGDLKKVIVYGIFGSTDLNCSRSQIDEDWNYKGSPFETIIQATGGLAYSLCDTNFGTSLSKIGDDIFKRIDSPKISLDRVPDISTLRVLFHGNEIPGGDQAQGGLWYYDERYNAVIFYDLSFAKNDTEEVTVKFEEDIGKK